VEEKPGGRGPGEEELAAEEEPLPDDQGEHAHVHRVPHDAVRAADDEALGRRPRRWGAAALEREASRRLEDERGAEHQKDAAENPQRQRLLVRVPPSQQPGHEARHDRRPAEEDEAERARRRT
jgi:hypothetical protein